MLWLIWWVTVILLILNKSTNKTDDHKINVICSFTFTTWLCRSVPIPMLVCLLSIFGLFRPPLVIVNHSIIGENSKYLFTWRPKQFLYKAVNILGWCFLKLCILAWESLGLTHFWKQPQVATRGIAVFGAPGIDFFYFCCFCSYSWQLPPRHFRSWCHKKL